MYQPRKTLDPQTEVGPMFRSLMHLAAESRPAVPRDKSRSRSPPSWRAWFNKARLGVTIGGMTCHGDLPQWQVTRTHGSLAPADSCARNTEHLPLASARGDPADCYL